MPSVAGPDPQDIRSFLVVEADGRWLAIGMHDVSAAVAPPPVTPLPFVPASVEGLVCINERILPLVNLRTLLGLAAGQHGGELVIVDTTRAPLALRVDRIVGKADTVATAMAQPAGDDDGAVCARFEWEDRTVLVLDTDALGQCVRAGDVPAGQRGLLGLPEAVGDTAGAARLECLLFSCAGESWAMDLRDAVEILDLPPATPVPGAHQVAEGLARVRESVVPVLSFARLIRRGECRADARTVIVVERAGVRYGLRIDRLSGVHAFAPEALRRIDDDTADLAGVLADGNSLHGLVVPERLIPAALHAALQPLVPRREARAEARQQATASFLQVAIGDDAFAIALPDVRRVARWSPAEPLPDAGAGLVVGAVTIDGNILPVVDIARALETAGADRGAWVVLGDGAREWTIAVREATDILEIPAPSIEELGTRGQGFLTAVASVGGRLISLLSIRPLLEGAALPADYPPVAGGGSRAG